MKVQLRLPLRGASPLAAKPFVRSEANAAAAARVMDWSAWPCGALALVGPEASGKSHLAAIWAASTDAWALDEGPGSGSGLSAGPAPGFGAARLAEDADRAMGDPAREEALFHALNRAAQGLGGPLLITGRAAPATWRCGLPDLRSRLNALPVATLAEPDDALLRQLLVGFFRERSIKPGEDLLDDLVRRMERSAAGAAALVEALDSACRQGARLGRPLARQVLDAASGVEEAPVEG